MSDIETAIVDRATVETFDRDGVVVLRGVFADWVDRLRDAVDEIIAKKRPSAVNHAEGTGGTFLHDADVWRDNATIRDFEMSSVALEIARALTGAHQLHLYGDHLQVKEPGSPDARTPWHQDEPYMRAAGGQMMSIWVALDRVTAETGAMRFVPGSHKWGSIYRPVRFAHGEEFAIDRFAESVPDIDGNPERYPVVSFDLEPGDCTVHHVRMLHSAGGNKSLTVRRRALVVRYAGEDVRYVMPNKQALRSANPRRAPGEPLDAEEFPLVT